MIDSFFSIYNAISPIDWFIVFLYLLVSFSIGVCFVRKASSNISSYFVSGRKLPWWLLGTSMVATTFAADTPLAVTGWVRSGGIWKNWFWWSYIFSHVLIVFVFARLWRRAEVITDNELIELRYSGRPAAFLRGFKAFYFSTLFNIVVMGWVISAMTKFLNIFFGFDTKVAVLICVAIALSYTMLSGLWGVVVTDFLQYIVALAGTIILVVVIINSSEIGGYEGFLEKLKTVPETNLNFFITPFNDPGIKDGFFDSNFFTFLVFFTLVWWSSHNADGGGYFIQRFCSAKDEKNAVLGMGWFTVNHYIIRFWPWVIIALASLIVFPKSESITGGDEEAVYVYMIKKFLGPGLTGLLLVTFLSAFMSTISTQLNWGASYIVNDIYRRFVSKHASNSHYVLVSRFTTFLLMVIAAIVSFRIKNIGDTWIFLWAMSSGIGFVLILRWFVWRINAWSEISALASSLLAIVLIYIYAEWQGVSLQLKHQILVIPFSMVVWIGVTLLTPPEPREKLLYFYKKVRPWGYWTPVIASSGLVEKPCSLFSVLMSWIAGCSFIFFAMMGVGKVILGERMEALFYIVISIYSALFVYFKELKGK